MDKDESAWRDAMAKEKMEWTQWRLTPEVSSEIGEAYNFNTIPFMLLIDPNGNIAFSGHDTKAIDAILAKHIKPKQ